MRIKWSRYLPITLAASLFAFLALTFAAQRSSASTPSIQACGAYQGNVCNKKCTRRCFVSGEGWKCCTWTYKYWQIIQ